MKKFIKGLFKFAVVAGTLFAGASWAMFAFFLKRKKDVDPETDVKVDLINENTVTDDYKMLDIKGWKWEQAHKDIYERLEITSDDGLKLVGHFFNQGAEKTALMVHGINAWHGSRLYGSQVYFEEGYNILAVDQRMYGESEGTYCTMGYKESDDMMLWMKLLTEEKGQKQIIMDGVSMGSATVMVCSGRDDLPDEVIGIVADCGYTSTKDMMEHQLRHGYRIPVSFPFVDLVKLYAERIGKFPVDERTPLQMVAKAKVPMLFIHGTADTFVPYDMVDELYNACVSEKDILRVEGAVHALSCLKDPNGYKDAVKAFIHKVERSA